jgi:hypothetical protein
MNECIETEVRDALPDLIHGRLSALDTATLTAHVESCADCRAEMELLRQLRTSAPLVPRMDVARIVSSLPLPMPADADLVAAAARTGTGARRSFIWKSAFAAALLVVGSLTFANARHVSMPGSGGQRAESAARVAGPAAALPQSVASVQSPSRAVTESLPSAPVKPARTTSNPGLSVAGVQDLTDDQLQALVNGLDNVRGLPSAEPEAVSIGVDDNEGMQ